MKNMKIAFNGKWIKVSVGKLMLPNGYLANYEIIRHPGASLIIPFLTKDTIIMIKQLRPVIGKYIYELPAGTIDEEESPLKCAKREIIEEIGYSAKKIKLLGKIYTVPGYSTEEIFIYKAEGLKKELHCGEPDEIIETCVMNKSKIKKLFKSGALVDAKTISALVFCGWL